MGRAAQDGGRTGSVPVLVPQWSVTDGQVQPVRPAEPIDLPGRDTVDVRHGQLRGAAWAYAHRGQVDEAQRAVAESTAERGPARDDLHDGLAGEFDFSPERVAMSNSATLLLLRDGPGAEASARRSLELGAAHATNTKQLVVAPQARADLASALLMRNELDGAAEALGPVLTLPREWRGAGLTVRVNAVRAELASPAFRGTPLAQDLAERIEDFTAVAAPRVLGPGTSRLALGGHGG
ncbi:hypothetical protein WN990_29630 [Kitasatospora purpeofusca]